MYRTISHAFSRQQPPCRELHGRQPLKPALIKLQLAGGATPAALCKYMQEGDCRFGRLAELHRETCLHRRVLLLLLCRCTQLRPLMLLVGCSGCNVLLLLVGCCGFNSLLLLLCLLLLLLCLLSLLLLLRLLCLLGMLFVPLLSCLLAQVLGPPRLPLCSLGLLASTLLLQGGTG